MFDCETETESGGVEWFKGKNKITDNTKYMESQEGYIYKLKIRHAEVDDSGQYRIIKNGIPSDGSLKVQALFKRKLENITIMEGLDIQFDCETEGDSSSVEWFKDDTPVKIETGNIKMETLPGNIHKLTISPARLQDSGSYKIEKNGISSEAILDVKALFKRKLENITIMEGLDIQFECETEGDHSSVEWFKDDTPVKIEIGNIKMETLPGNIHKLTISPARLQDSGSYKIEKNGISSEAILDVKGTEVNWLFINEKKGSKKGK
ncbi:unnamed protein product [Mytilus edulis]|uniref:Ig-like domain-containing protein n=1 Tax=Mytilus edulis TaxID=6550 RepID=A0A8S3QZ43_MYTED|nr:unnamed protein product [Mytilus edulis]